MRRHLLSEVVQFFSIGYFTLSDRTCFSSFFAVPASVQGIIADNVYSSHSLIVSWQKAIGVAERYDVLLLNENGILLSNTSEPASTKQHKFEDLTPGKKYKIQILTVSGGLFSKKAQTEGRTGNSHSLLFSMRCLLVCYSLRSVASEGQSKLGGDIYFLTQWECSLRFSTSYQSAYSHSLQPTTLQFRFLVKTGSFSSLWVL